MANVLNTNVLEDGHRNYIVRLQGVLDGTDESVVKKVDISGLKGPDGSATPPVSFSVEHINYNIQGIDYVQLLFDAATNDELATLPAGQSEIWFEPPFADPRTTTFTGDILLTTVGAVLNGSYDITLSLRKKD